MINISKNGTLPRDCKRWVCLHPSYLPMFEKIISTIEKKGNFPYFIVQEYLDDGSYTINYLKKIRTRIINMLVKHEIIQAIKNNKYHKKYKIINDFYKSELYKRLENHNKAGIKDLKVIRKIIEITEYDNYWTYELIRKSLNFKKSEILASIQRLKKRGLLEKRDDIVVYRKIKSKKDNKLPKKKVVLLPPDDVEELIIKWYG
jgi:hypothetical protein